MIVEDHVDGGHLAQHLSFGEMDFIATAAGEDFDEIVDLNFVGGWIKIDECAGMGRGLGSRGLSSHFWRSDDPAEGNFCGFYRRMDIRGQCWARFGGRGKEA